MSSISMWSLREVVIHSVSIVALVMYLLEGLSRRATEVLIAGLRAIVAITLKYARNADTLTTQDNLLLADIARDPRTVMRRYKLEPVLDTYVCCPDCFAIYSPNTSPKTCVDTAPGSTPCGCELFRTRQIRGGFHTSSKRDYLHQPMAHWLARLVHREGIEDLLQIPDLQKILSKNPPTVAADFWDGAAIRSFLGPDGRKLFIDAPQDETRLVFSLAMDGFNPFQSKTAKQKVTSTAIYMVCLNLPPHLRYLPENMYLVGVIPGPTKPSLTQINHFLRLLVDDLLQFWTSGVRFSRTWKYRFGRLFRAALIPLVCDILAARQTIGLGSHSSTFFCSFCYLRLDEIENFDPLTWPPREIHEHRARAEAWRNAPTALEQEDLFERHGIRWSELLRLPYWDPIHFTVVDSMHNLYLGLLQTHCRDIWGISVDLDDGDATAHPTKKPPQFPSSADWQKGLHALHHGTLAELMKCKKAVLWHLCDQRELRRAGAIKQLAKELDKWVCRKCLATTSVCALALSPRGLR